MKDSLTFRAWWNNYDLVIFLTITWFYIFSKLQMTEWVTYFLSAKHVLFINFQLLTTILNDECFWNV